MSKVKPIPDGYHTLTPYLVVRGADKAMDFYKKAFGAEELFRMPGPDGQTVMHGEMKIGDSIFMLSEECPEMGSVSPKSIGGCGSSVHVYLADVDAAMKRAVTAGATTKMPATDMFWGDRFGKLEDPFGHQWSIATHMKDLSPAEMQKAAQAAFAEASGSKKK